MERTPEMGNNCDNCELWFLHPPDSATILDLCLLKIKFGLPYFFDANGFKILKKLLARKLVIKGLLSHFAALVKLTKVFSVIRN